MTPNEARIYHIVHVSKLPAIIIALPVGNGTECIGCAVSEASRPVERWSCRRSANLPAAMV